ncbi:hypothetical protein [Alloactinosynnema sp. L-07]|uniref:hypothetical protein n=1 Tax=Alloactinosynnema sp. L-07 TaxID=1653480 RepID=UPI00065EFFA7|nr:hypothetical protein [Alloactinosynnema sp. L-07]CRK57557.1 hypothetical protein [Alloactinosynnema sp. L-07]
MLLTKGQRLELAGMVARFIGANKDYDAVVVLFGPDLVRATPDQPNAFQYAEGLLREALRRPTVEMFAHVLMTVDPVGELGDVHKIVHRVTHGEIEWEGGDIDPVWMPPESMESPFANRDRLRAALCEMAEGGGFPAVTVEAPAGHGKLTMSHYIEYRATRAGKFQPMVEHLLRLDTDQVVPHLARKLWRRLGIPGEPTNPVSRVPDRRSVDIAAELARKALLGTNRVWFVANVVRPNLDDGVWTFLDELMRLVRTDPDLAKKLKVTVLADFTAVELPNKPEIDARFTLPDIGAQEIAGWLAAAVPGKDARLYALAASIVMEKVDRAAPAPAMRLAVIAERCVVARHELLEAK